MLSKITLFRRMRLRVHVCVVVCVCVCVCSCGVLPEALKTVWGKVGKGAMHSVLLIESTFSTQWLCIAQGQFKLL